MNKYLQIIKGTWAEYMEYRLNFVLWRLRMVSQILVTYFLWWALFANTSELFGYTQSMMLTYVLLTNLARTIILGTRTMDISNMINSGAISNYLLRPVHFFHLAVARDVGDKALNVAFAAVEVTALFLLLRPEIFLQANAGILLATLGAVILATILYFFFSLTLSFFGFWTPDVWPVRFISFVVMEFFAGGLFPLDILPQPLFAISQSLPFFYFIYFPIKVYLGQLSSTAIFSGLVVGLGWAMVFWYLATLLWRRGLRLFAAEGR